MTTPLTCQLWVDGVRVADGQPGEAAGEPAALSGLSVTWGRSTTVDQPPPATCSFELTDPGGGRGFAEVVRVGSEVRVVTDATVYPDPTVSIVADPGYEAAAVGSVPPLVVGNGSAVVTDAQAATGAHSVQVDPLNSARAVTVTIPPAPFVPAGTDPTAWDTVPSTDSGQRWTVGLSVLAPHHAWVEAAAVYFTGPWATAATYVPGAVIGLSGDGAWHTLRLDVVPPSGVWVGVALRLYPTGPRWVDVPPGMTWAGSAGTWLDTSWLGLARTWLDDVTVLAPAQGALQSVVVFDGRVSDTTASWDADAAAVLLEATAVDFTADLGNRDIGADPWPAEGMGARFRRVVALSGAPVDTIVDPALEPLTVTWMDVDRQQTMGLLQDLAQSVDGVVWPAVHATLGAYLWVEDPAARAALYVLEMGEDGLVHIVPTAMISGAVELSACDILRDPVQWVQDAADVVTRVATQWLDQTLDDKGYPSPTQRTYTVVDAAAEADLGTRRASVSTLLTTQADAAVVADKLLGRLRVSQWRVQALTWDTDTTDDFDSAYTTKALALLDGTTRIGRPVLLADLPEWTPTGRDSLPVYVEGGTYDYTDGAWTLALTVSSGLSQGASVAWNELPAGWSWAEFAPGLSWDQLAGVGPPLTTTERDENQEPAVTQSNQPLEGIHP